MKISYPNTLGYAINDLVTNCNYNVNDVLEAFQFLYSEYKLSQSITWTMRTNAMTLLHENNAPYKAVSVH